jgi:ethanolamine utilization protein EutA
LESKSILLDEIHLNSVGVDVGSSTTVIVISKIGVRRSGRGLSSRFSVFSRELVHSSEPVFTPFTSDGRRIDVGRLKEIIGAAYEGARIRKEEVDLGVVIMTGEAAAKENSKAIGEMIAENLGDFLSVVAGHNMESALAAHGSGAVAISRAEGIKVLNVDIGGGTTKLALVDNGEVKGTEAFYLGGRSLIMDEEGRVIRVEPSAAFAAERVGVEVQRGGRLDQGSLQRIARWMASKVVKAVNCENDRDLDQLLLTQPMGCDEVRGVVFSGGVAEYIYGRERKYFNDLGKFLGLEIRSAMERGELRAQVLEGAERIRATVCGASQFTVQVSGNTIYVSNGSILPVRNAKVITVEYEGGKSAEEVAKAIRSKAKVLEIGEGVVALAVRWRGSTSYENLLSFANGVREGLEDYIRAGKPLVLVFDEDVGRNLGLLLREELGVGVDVVAVDGVRLQDLDFVDIGRRVEPLGPVPVTVKSLVFGIDAQFLRARNSIHRG